MYKKYLNSFQGHCYSRGEGFSPKETNSLRNLVRDVNFAGLLLAELHHWQAR